ncbi:hypothetical protein [Calothrix sp. PCC 6303]|uniref:hypothetical protein n=1 Tax=Calothrix sp. PCC 6303 TaxID=1170562 RepID=UPI0002A03AA0|nr:hypothetical protein [Calothrix sp. PCC 6303]AFY99367.1 hypothetical protein Cal6303_0270 [Calothrix sp. PCC 6303]
MSYFEQLHPWCIIRTLPSKECILVARFRRRNDAFAYQQVLQRNVNNICFVVKFNPQA